MLGSINYLLLTDYDRINLEYSSFLILVILLFLNIILLSSSLDWVVLWVSLEINTFVFLIIEKSQTKIKTEFEFKYFLIQFFGSRIFLFRWLFNNELLLFISIIVKLILIPFLNWILEGLKWISSKLQLIFLSVQKIGPSFLLWRLHLNIKFDHKVFLIFNLAARIWAGVTLTHWIDLLAISSNGQTTLIVFLLFFSKSGRLIYLMAYIIRVILFLIIIKFRQETMLIFIFIRGFPPSLIFFAKLNFLWILTRIGLQEIVLFTLFFRTMFYVYMKIFMISFTWIKKAKTFDNIVRRILFILIIWTCFG